MRGDIFLAGFLVSFLLFRFVAILQMQGIFILIAHCLFDTHPPRYSKNRSNHICMHFVQSQLVAVMSRFRVTS